RLGVGGELGNGAAGVGVAGRPHERGRRAHQLRQELHSSGPSTHRRAQQRLVPLVEAAVADLCPDSAAGVPRSIGIADLGCSSGPNTLFLVSVAVDALRHRCAAAGVARPEVRVFLNDLPDNDFNTVFRHVPGFLQQTGEPDAGNSVFVFGAPGSFFGRLFPEGNLHVAISSFSLHWLSQVPQELTTGELVNRGSICAGRKSSSAVIEAYARQSGRDFTLFLESRAKEVVAGGWLLASLKGRSARDMSSEGCAINEPHRHPQHHGCPGSFGLVDAARLESYNIPIYDPCAEEVREIVAAEGSFEMVGMESFEVPACNPVAFAGVIRAVYEPMLERHFEAGIDMEQFVRVAEEHLDRLRKEGSYKGLFVHIMSLRRRICDVLNSDYSRRDYHRHFS
ncbi:hypothetical protein EJB05_21219, partial [Eragrostis curvula]